MRKKEIGFIKLQVSWKSPESALQIDSIKHMCSHNNTSVIYTLLCFVFGNMGYIKGVAHSVSIMGNRVQ